MGENMECPACGIRFKSIWYSPHCPNCGGWYEYPDPDEDNEPVGDDGYPLDMDDETKAWLSTNH